MIQRGIHNSTCKSRVSTGGFCYNFDRREHDVMDSTDRTDHLTGTGRNLEERCDIRGKPAVSEIGVQSVRFVIHPPCNDRIVHTLRYDPDELRKLSRIVHILLLIHLPHAVLVQLHGQNHPIDKGLPESRILFFRHFLRVDAVIQLHREIAFFELKRFFVKIVAFDAEMRHIDRPLCAVRAQLAVFVLPLSGLFVETDTVDRRTAGARHGDRDARGEFVLSGCERNVPALESQAVVLFALHLREIAQDKLVFLVLQIPALEVYLHIPEIRHRIFRGNPGRPDRRALDLLI